MKIHGQRLLKTHWIRSQPTFLSPCTGTKQLHMPSALITLCQIHHTPDDDIKTKTVYATSKKSRPVYIMKTQHFGARGKNINKTTTRFIHKYAKIPTPNGTNRHETDTNQHHQHQPARNRHIPTSTGIPGTNRHKPAQQARPASTGTPASPGTDSQKHPIKKTNQVMIIMNKSYQICSKIRPKLGWTVLVKQHRFYHTENFVFRQGHTLTMRDPTYRHNQHQTGYVKGNLNTEIHNLRLLNRSTSLMSATFKHETGPTITDPSEVLWLLTSPPPPPPPSL